MERLPREVFPYLVVVAPLIFGFLVAIAGLVFGGSAGTVHTLPLPQPGPVGP